MAVTVGGAPLTGVAGITTGAYHACATLDNGTAVCWGTNSQGQLGNGPSGPDRPSPLAVTQSLGGAPLTGVAGIAAGLYHTCARMVNGTAMCWGINGNGQLGNGGGGDSPVPVAVTWPGGEPLTGVAQIAAGQYHTCATLVNGTAVCWGLGGFGQLGDGSGGDQLNPVPVSNLTGVTLVAAGSQSTCAVASGKVACFGLNRWGQLGVTDNAGTTNANPSPLTMPGQDPSVFLVVGVAVGDAHACVWLAGDVVACFGRNNNGQLGRNSTNTAINTSPAAVSFT